MWGPHLHKAFPDQVAEAHLGQGPPSGTLGQFLAVLFPAPASGSSSQRHGTVPALTASASAGQLSVFLFPTLAGWRYSGQVPPLPFSRGEERVLVNSSALRRKA